MSELLKKIKSRGYWRVIIRPTTFDEKHVANISHLYPIVERCSVQFRGWDYPHLDTRKPPCIDTDWVGQEFEWEEFLEIWRLHQSGQFVHIFGMDEDWRDQSKWPQTQHFHPSRPSQSGASLGMGNALFHFAEIFEFAARLALTEAGDQSMHVEITVNGLQGRVLYNDTGGGFPFRGPKATLSSLPYAIDVSQAELIADPRWLALEPAAELYRRFGEEFSKQTLLSLLDKLQR